VGAHNASRAEIIERFTRYIEAQPDTEYVASARFNLALLLLEQAEAGDGDLSAAIAQLEIVTAAVAAGRAGRFGQHAQAWYLLGRCLAPRNPDRSLQAYEKALASAVPQSDIEISSRIQLGQAALVRRQFDQALTHFQQAMAPGPQHPSWESASYLQATTLYRADLHEKASLAFAELLAQQDPSASALRAETIQHLALSVLEQCSDGKSTALQVAEPALAQLPETARHDLLTGLAELLEKAGSFEDAAAALQLRDGKRKRQRRRDRR